MSSSALLGSNSDNIGYSTVKTTTSIDSPPAPQDSTAWRVTHAAGFAIGGTTFIAGTACLYDTSIDPTGLKSAVLYTIGSLGFLYVDVLEFVTFTDNIYLRMNISMSAVCPPV